MIDGILTDVATVRPWISEDADGPAYGEGVQIRCRAEVETHTSMDANAVSARVIFPAGTRFPLRSSVAIGGVEYRLTRLSPMIALTEHHVEAELF